MGLLKALFGNYSEKEIKRIKPMQEKVLALDEEYQKLTDDELRHKTDEFKERLSAGETLDRLPRGRKPRARYEALPRAGNRRYYTSPRQNCRNENR